MENNHRYSEKIYTNSKGYNTRPAIVLSTTCWWNELDIARKSSTNYSHPRKRVVLENAKKAGQSACIAANVLKTSDSTQLSGHADSEQETCFPKIDKGYTMIKLRKV